MSEENDLDLRSENEKQKDFIELATKIIETYEGINFKNAFLFKKENYNFSIENRWLGLPVVFSISFTTDDLQHYQAEAICKVHGDGVVLTKSIYTLRDYNEFINRFYKVVIDCRLDNAAYIDKRQVISDVFDMFYEKKYEMHVEE